MTGLGIAVAFGVGVLVGVVLHAIASERAFRLAARYQQGQPLMPRETRDDRRPHGSPDASAHRQITEHSLKLAEQQLTEAYRAAGVKVPNAKALRAEAEQMFAGGSPLGGVT